MSKKNLEIKKRKWFGHTKGKDPDTVEKQAPSWKPQGQSKIERPRKIWRRTVQVKSREAGKSWEEIKALAANRVHWRCFVEAL